MPAISVLMSVYNDETYVSESIESILKQSYSDFEFIIIDDGSTDESQSIIKRYADHDDRIVYINQQNVGLTKSLNNGLSFCRGKLIARQDSDDISDLDRLRQQYEFMRTYSNISVCFCWTRIIEQNGERLGDLIFSTKPSKIKKNLLQGRNIYTHGSAIFRKESILSVGGYSNHIKEAQDFDLWLKLLHNNEQFGAINLLLYDRRVHNKSISILKGTEQRINSNLSLNKKSETVFTGSRKLKNPILDHYHNIFFRSQARRKILKNTVKLIRCNDVTFRHLAKTIIAMCPVNYKFLFKYL